MKFAKELKNKSIKDLEKEERSLREEIAKMKLQSKTNPPKDTNALVKKRKRLAVALTFLTEKKEVEKFK